LFDSPPVLVVADAAILASRVSGSLLVIDAKRTRRRATMHAKEEIERVGGRLIGSVLNSFNPKWSSYYYGAYHYSSVNGGGGSRLNGGGEQSRLRSRLSVGR
jgi:Mrp family chromosome partitioning ATPase